MINENRIGLKQKHGTYNVIPPYGSEVNIGNMYYMDFPPTEISSHYFLY